jgi:ferritin-like protein
MSPKEKAIDLVDLMHNTSHCEGKHFPNNNYCECSEINFFQAKQCALIAVAEIINVTVGLNGWIDGFQYWEEVKQEIEKL